MVRDMRNRNKINRESFSSAWESFGDSLNPFFERRGGRIVGGKGGGSSRGEDKLMRMGGSSASWSPASKSKVDIHSSKKQDSREKNFFLDRLKKRSSKMSAETASTAASTWGSSSSTATTCKDGSTVLHSPTLTEDLQLEKSNISEDLLSKPSLLPPPPPGLPQRFRLAEDEGTTSKKLQLRPRARKANDKDTREEEVLLALSSSEQYESFEIPPKKRQTTSPNKIKTTRKEEREACMRFALEDFRETVTTSVNNAIHMWSRVQSIFFHDSSPEEVEELRKRMDGKPDTPHPTTVFIVPSITTTKPAKEQLVTLESLADSLTNPTCLEDSNTEVSSLTEPQYISAKPIPPLFRMRKQANASSSAAASRKSKKSLPQSAPVKEIHVLFDDHRGDAECIEFKTSGEKEPYDEKDELLFHDASAEKNHFDAKFDLSIASAGNSITASQSTEMSLSDRFRQLTKQAETMQLIWNSTSQHSRSADAFQPIGEVEDYDLDSISC